MRASRGDMDHERNEYGVENRIRRPHRATFSATEVSANVAWTPNCQTIKRAMSPTTVMSIRLSRALRSASRANRKVIKRPIAIPTYDAGPRNVGDVDIRLETLKVDIDRIADVAKCRRADSYHDAPSRESALTDRTSRSDDRSDARSHDHGQVGRLAENPVGRDQVSASEGRARRARARFGFRRQGCFESLAAGTASSKEAAFPHRVFDGLGIDLKGGPRAAQPGPGEGVGLWSRPRIARFTRT